MRCNAGRNYLVFKPSGQAFRCLCHLDKPLGDMASIERWLPGVDLSCPIMDTCQRHHEEEWKRSSRINDQDDVVDRGTMAGQPNNEVVTRISLVGEEERSPGEWCALLDRLARRYKKCWHRIEGGDPADFQGIAQLVEKVSFLGDHLFYVTDLSSSTTRLVDVLAKASVDCVQFVMVVDPSSSGFNEIKVLGRLFLVHERGFKVSAVMPGTLSNIWLFESFHEKAARRGIPMVFSPREDIPPSLQAKVASLVEMGVSPTQAKASVPDAFNGL